MKKNAITRRNTWMIMSFTVLCLFVMSSHDMFLKMDTYHLQTNQPSTILLYNGTFDKSDNVITRDRMIDVALVGGGSRTSVDTSAWTEDGKTTVLNFTTGQSGTWLAGVSTKARNIELEAEAFNDYLEHDGVIDMLSWRKENGAMDQDAVEKYSKHVKTIFQVGDKKTADYKTVLNYPIEFVPMRNPYTLRVGHTLPVQLLRDGSPLPNQLVYVAGVDKEHTHDHDHEHGDDHSHTHGATQLTTDDQGVVTMDISNAGIWYLRTIHMEHRNSNGLTHESNWATLTFEVKSDKERNQHLSHDGHDHDHGHSHDGHDSHDHDHDHHHGPDGHTHWYNNYTYMLGAALVLLLLYFFFKRSRS